MAYSEKQNGQALFSPLNAAAVKTEELVADRDTRHVQALMDQPECVAGLQSFLHLWPEGSQLSQQLRGILLSECFDRGQRAFIWRNCGPHTYNSPETVFWTKKVRNHQKSSIVHKVPRQKPVLSSEDNGNPH